MLLGLGTDIIDNRRIENTLKRYGKKFKNRCFTNNEIKKSENKINEVNSFAKRYAAKEACSKALGTGLSRGVYWKDIEIINDKYGKPYIILYNSALDRLKKIYKCSSKIEISLSDEKNYSIANVIIYKDEK